MAATAVVLFLVGSALPVAVGTIPPRPNQEASNTLFAAAFVAMRAAPAVVGGRVRRWASRRRPDDAAPPPCTTRGHVRPGIV